MMSPAVFLLDKPNLVGYLGECLVIVFAFRNLERRPEKKWTFFALTALFLNFVLYLTSGTGNAAAASPWLHFVGRAVFHAAAVCLYLCLAKTLPWRSCLLLSLLYISGYQFSIGMRLLFSSISLGGKGLFSSLFSTLAVLFCQLAWALVLRRIIRISDLSAISFSRWGLTGTLTLLQIYIRWSLMPSLGGSMALPIWLRQVEYPLIAMAGLLLVEVFYEESISMQARAARERTERLCLEYELKNARQQTRASDDVRRIYHDMKNHLLSIRTMDSSREVRQYTEDLLSQFDDYENTVCTGNAVADSLLFEKIMLSRLDNVLFNVCMDLTPLSFIRPVDMVTIFGNAVDNCLEAVKKLPQEKRRIYLRSINNPGFVTLVFSNPFKEACTDASGALVTSKEDKTNHGLGLNSMRHAAERYDGVIKVSLDDARHYFDLTILIPLPLSVTK